jgi:aldehyde:ferredoxin oxidoreductase
MPDRDRNFFLYVNMDKCEIEISKPPEKYLSLGGRALTSSFILDNVDPICFPLGRFNKLIIAPGLLSHSSIPCTGRLSIGAKSPLTGTIKESNVGGTASKDICRLGYRAIVIEGKPESDKLYVLVITPDNVKLVEKPELKGKGNYETVKILKDEFGKRVSVLSIGPAGEMGMAAAGIAVTNIEGMPSRFAGRGGLGAVMGSKGIKAIVIDPKNLQLPKPVNSEKYKELLKDYVSKFKENPVTSTVLPTYGTANIVSITQELGAIPTRNFSEGRFEAADLINGYALKRLTDERGGKTGHPCYPGCIIKCSNIYNDPNGGYLTSGLEYETIVLLGSNCGIGDLDTIAKLDRLCDDYGIDTIETGAAVGVAMEAGVLNFGDGEGTIDLVHQIGRGTTLGRILGQGAGVTGRVFNVYRTPVVKNQSLAAYDPRALKGGGVTYATTPMGADHTNGNGLGGNSDPLRPEGQVEYSRYFQIAAAYIDSLGLCWFTRGPLLGNLELLAEISNSYLGLNLTKDSFETLGKQVISTEKEFNRRAGFNSSHDRLPEFFKLEPLKPHNVVFDVPDEELDNVHNW